VIPAVVIVVALTPLLLLAVGAATLVHRLRLRRAVTRSECDGCGKILGADAMWLARLIQDEHIREERERHPRAHLTWVRTTHAVCANCLTRHRFSRDDRRFIRFAPVGPRRATTAGGSVHA
jgi:hypothetical protein